MTCARRRPTLAELRASAQKQRHREIGNWLARHFGRPAAIYGTWLAVRLGMSPHAVTCLALCASLAAAGLVASGVRWLFVIGVGLAHLGFWLDHVDGQVARYRSMASLDGTYFDYLLHHVANLAMGFGLGYGLANRSGDSRWAIAGFSIALGWAVLSLHNDCRYKALFQRLKSTNLRYIVEGGAGGHPAPAPAWPRRGLGLVTWPAYKVCESHAVLLQLSALAALAALVPVVWLVCWRSWVIAIATLAPLLGLARITKSIVQGQVEAEFARWFRAIGETTPDPFLPGETTPDPFLPGQWPCTIPGGLPARRDRRA
jgi:hypothetical protein